MEIGKRFELSGVRVNGSSKKIVACGAAGPRIAYSVDIGLKGLRAG